MSGTITRIGATGAGALLALGILAVPPAGATGGHRDGRSERSGRSDTASCFTASGRTQGRSQSDPDGMRNGGADKPGCTGGVSADRDGNNGCGNDDDREDDNNGRCGGAKSKAIAQPQAQQKSKVKGGRTGRGRCERDEVPVSSTTSSTSTTTTTAPPTIPIPATGTGLQLEAAGTVPPLGVLAEDLTTTTAGTPVPTDAISPVNTDPVAVGAAASATDPGTEVLGESITRPETLARTGAGVGGIALLGGLLCGGGRLAVLARRLLRIG
jgi:hypothetical protein